MGIDKINAVDLPQSTTAPATTTPSVSLSGGTFGVVEATVTKSGGGSYTNPNYSAVCTLADGTVTVTDAKITRNLESDSSHLAGTLNIADTHASAEQRTITVKAQEFEDRKQSAATTATYTPSGVQNKYVRITGVNSDGSATANYMGILDIRFYTAGGQSGTAYPTTNLTANDSETGIVVSQGAVLNATYASWKGADSNTTGTMAWLLTASAANNWWQIEFEDGTYGTKPIIKSVRIITNIYMTNHSIRITGSNNADHSSATDYGIYTMAKSSTINIG
jgi:hypothetical protein